MRAGLTLRRWRRPDERELEAVVRRLSTWPAPSGGAVRHQFPLAAIESGGAGLVRITGEAVGEDGSHDGDATGLGVIVQVGRDVMVAAGDPAAILHAVGPSPMWRLLVGERTACDALLSRAMRTSRLIVHDQVLLALDATALPASHELPDPGRRMARPEDAEALADLAVQLHVDDGFGPEPGPNGRRGYLSRLTVSVRAGVVDCVGPPGSPVAKLERSVDHARLGMQFAGIVVDRARRSEGIGRGLVAAAARAAVIRGRLPLTLHTRVANEPALAAYAAAGFVPIEPWRLAIRP